MKFDHLNGVRKVEGVLLPPKTYAPSIPPNGSTLFPVTLPTLQCDSPHLQHRLREREWARMQAESWSGVSTGVRNTVNTFKYLYLIKNTGCLCNNGLLVQNYFSSDLVLYYCLFKTKQGITKNKHNLWQAKRTIIICHYELIVIHSRFCNMERREKTRY